MRWVCSRRLRPDEEDPLNDNREKRQGRIGEREAGVLVGSLAGAKVCLPRVSSLDLTAQVSSEQETQPGKGSGLALPTCLALCHMGNHEHFWFRWVLRAWGKLVNSKKFRGNYGIIIVGDLLYYPLRLYKCKTNLICCPIWSSHRNKPSLPRDEFLRCLYMIINMEK